jgi:DNA polymerase-3 subunit delta'
MTLRQVEGQPRAVETVRAALRSGALHHAYLFTGPEGVGKELLALGLIQALLCRAVPGEGCGECDACRRVESRNHPDVSWLMPQEEMIARGLAGRSDFSGTVSREVRVEQVRKLQERLALRALEGGHKVAVIASAQQMNPQAQNALLKTLEEPPAGTLLLLLCTAVDRLLPTILSRCARVSFGPLPQALIRDHLVKKRQLEPEIASLAAVLADGSLSRALALDVGGLKRRREIIERFEALTPGDARPWLRFSEEFGASRDEAREVLRILALWIRDVALAQVGAGGLANQDLAELAQAAARRCTPEALHRRQELVGQTREAISDHYASARLALDRMLIGMLTPTWLNPPPESWKRP